MRTLSRLSLAAAALCLAGCPDSETPCEPLVVEGPLHPWPTPMFSVSVHAPEAIRSIGPESGVRRLTVDLSVPVPVALVHQPLTACAGKGYAACTMLLSREELWAAEPGGALSHGGSLIGRWDERIELDIDSSPDGDLYFVWLEDPPEAPVLDGSIRAELAVCRPAPGSWILVGSVLRPAPVCGNGILEEGEPCDDGNVAPMDGCRVASVLDGGVARQTCVVEEALCDPGVAWIWRSWSCAGEPSVCESLPCEPGLPGCAVEGGSLALEALLRGRHVPGHGEANRVVAPEHGVDCACREEAGGAVCTGCLVDEPCAAVEAIPGAGATLAGWVCGAVSGARCHSLALTWADRATAWFDAGATGFAWRGPAVDEDRAAIAASLGPDSSSASIEQYKSAAAQVHRALVLRGPDGEQTAAITLTIDPFALTHDPDGGVALVGGLWSAATVVDQTFWKATEAHDPDGARDLLVVRFDAKGELTGSWQQGLELPYSALQAAAGSYRSEAGAALFVVAAENTVDGVTDMVALDAHGEEAWFRTLGADARVEAISQGGPAVALVVDAGSPQGALHLLDDNGKSVWTKEISWTGAVRDRPAVSVADDGSVTYVGPWDGERAALVVLDPAGELVSARPITGGEGACRAFFVATGSDAIWVAHRGCGPVGGSSTVVSRWPLGDGAPEWVERLGGPGQSDAAYTTAFGVGEGALRLLGAFRGSGDEPALEVRLEP